MIFVSDEQPDPPILVGPSSQFSRR